VSTVLIGQNDVPIGVAVAMLLTEVHALQTKNGEFSGRINELLAQNAALNLTIANQNATDQTELQVLNTRIQQMSVGNQAAGSSFDISSTIPKFTGSHKDNIHNFFTKIEQARKIGNWNEQCTLLITKQFLDGEALEWVQSDDITKGTENYEEFQQLMCDRFKKKATPRFYREQLSTIKIKDNEEIEHYADRIRSINHHTYTLSDSAEKNEAIRYEADQRALDAFLNGLS
jgi:hypothetical protein